MIRAILMITNVQLFLASIMMLSSNDFPDPNDSGFWAVLLTFITPLFTLWAVFIKKEIKTLDLTK